MHYFSVTYPCRTNMKSCPKQHNYSVVVLWLHIKRAEDAAQCEDPSTTENNKND